MKFDAAQVKTIIDRVVPLVAEPEDHEFFRGILHVRAESSTSAADFGHFIARLLSGPAGTQAAVNDHSPPDPDQWTEEQRKIWAEACAPHLEFNHIVEIV